MKAMHIIDANGRIENTINVEDPADFPDLHLEDASIGGQIGWAWNDGNPAPVPPDLGPLRDAAIAQTYVDVDKVYADAIGNRAEEYKEAESDARAYKAAGYTGTVSDYIHGYALKNPTGQVQSDQWSADTIIARADAFASAKLSMRNQRFTSQEAMRTAAAQANLDAAVAAWNGYITNLRAQLGL